MATTYTLRFKNRSGSQHDFLAYQQGIDVDTPFIYTLAWFAKPVANGVDVDFSWMIDYGFVWSLQGTLEPGVTFNANGFVPADLTSANLITFTNQYGVLQCGPPTAGGTAGSLTIDCDGTVPPRTAMVGIGMSGQGTHVVGAEPNFGNVFTPHPQYWIAFGKYLQNQVLDTETMVNATQVDFPANVYAMTATLDAGDDWALMQGLV